MGGWAVGRFANTAESRPHFKRFCKAKGQLTRFVEELGEVVVLVHREVIQSVSQSQYVRQFRQGTECDIQVSPEFLPAALTGSFSNVSSTGEGGASSLGCEPIQLVFGPCSHSSVDCENQVVAGVKCPELLIPFYGHDLNVGISPTIK